MEESKMGELPDLQAELTDKKMIVWLERECMFLRAQNTGLVNMLFDMQENQQGKR